MSGPVFLNFEVTPTSHTLADYRARGGYRGAGEGAARDARRDEVGEQVKASGLQGRGGAGFTDGPEVGLRRRRTRRSSTCAATSTRASPAPSRTAGSSSTRRTSCSKACCSASYALRVRHAFAYIRGEFDLPLRRLQRRCRRRAPRAWSASTSSAAASRCDIVIHRGAGAYVCGEESSLINSLEGKKGFPRNKPPFPAVRGLYQRPTVVNNVETLATVPWIMRQRRREVRGDRREEDARARACSASPATSSGRASSSSPTGYPLAQLIQEDAGGVLGGKRAEGGDSGRQLDADPDGGRGRERHARSGEHGKAGSMLGSGAVIVIAEGTCMVTAAAGAVALLRARVLRPVHAVPRGHRLDEPRSWNGSSPAGARPADLDDAAPHARRASTATRSARSATRRRCRSRAS